MDNECHTAHNCKESMLKILINPDYGYMRPFVENIGAAFSGGVLLQKGHRNTLRTFTVHDTEFVVKQFGKPNLFNRIVYSLIRKPKGLRAYEYAFRIQAAGFDTPTPVAYVEKRHMGLIGHSYFISTRCPYGRRFYEFGDADPEKCRIIVQAFARYAAAMHEVGILHRDFSPGNILFEENAGGCRFSIVDINRMRFGRVSVERGCRNFARLWGQIGFFRILADEYAAARHADPEHCFDVMRKARAKFWKRFSKRHKIKYRLEL